METSGAFLYFSSSPAFKSYYVVWKRHGFVCLQGKHLQFKSYYVVWKQAKGEGIFQGDVWFKSYYVVWKLFRKISRPRASDLFKSYYVVWKPRGFHSFLYARRGLNRTM